MKNYSTLVLALVLSAGARAQVVGPEHVEALHVRPAKGSAPAVRTGDLHEWFIYEYLPQQVPVVDDFSVDRTRHLNARSTDPGVSLTETIYHLEVGGSSTPDMQFTLDSTYHVTVDVQPDTVIITSVPLPSVTVRVYDISAYPPPDTVEMEMWLPYSLKDTVGDPTTDTTHLPPAFTQDSLLVYTVAALTGTYTNPDNSTRPLILWEDDNAFVNGTYPLDPPTIGVASFDGMDRTGYPYDPENPNGEGPADVMTSVPINWPSGTDVSDSVYLSFFIQPQGLSGDVEVDENDSLWLDLYSPSQDLWFTEWSTHYTPLAPFMQVMLPITYPGYLQDGFRMRFSNRATLGGAVDHWHIDYVRLGLNRSATDTLLQDVAWAYPANTLLAPWTSVPLAKYNEDPSHYMAVNVDLKERNLYNVDALITTGAVIEDCGAGGGLTGPANIINNASTTFITNIAVNSSPNSYTYNLSGCTDAAFPTTKFWTLANPDALRYNDTTTVTQEISNFYSYDDGSAEAGYWLNTNGARLAYRFDTQGQDSLRAVRMYFDPIFTYGDIPNDPRDGNFLITVWQDLDQDPIFQNITFSSPEYRLWGPDYFVEYPLDSTIAVGGTFYVGWTQTNAVKMNLGLDKNRVNSDKMFYNVGDTWQQSQAAGSWMIRPVMVSAVDPFAAVRETEVPNTLQLFPNPSSDEVRVRFTGGMPRSIELLDATGRKVLTERYRMDGMIAVDGLAEGLYVVRAVADDGQTLAQERLIVQH